MPAHFGESIRRPGVLIAAPWPPASLSPFQCCCDSGKSEIRALTRAAVMGVPLGEG